MSHLTYLLTIIVFCSVPFLVMLHYQKRVLRRYELVILVISFLGVLGTLTDYFGIRWRAWYYMPAHTLNIHFMTEVESYLFGGGIALLVSSATIISANMIDRKNRNTKRTSKKKA